MDQRLAVVVLAAGRGRRMESDLPKPLVEVAGAPMVRWVVDAAARLRPQRILCVVPPRSHALSRELRPLELIVQPLPDGPGGALRATEPRLRGFCGDILVLPADAPMLDTRMLEAGLRARRAESRPQIVVCGGILKDPTGYGRLKRDSSGRLLSIVEEAHVAGADRSLRLCNLGPMIVDAEALWPLLGGLARSEITGEYYTTDMVAAAAGCGMRSEAVVTPSAPPLSVNTPAQRRTVERLMRGRAPPRWRAKRYGTIRAAVREARTDLLLPDKGFIVVRSVLSEAEIRSFRAERAEELATLPSGDARINNERMFDYVHRRSHDDVGRTTRIYKFIQNANADELVLYRRVLKIRRVLESSWRRDPLYRRVTDAQHVFNIVTIYDEGTGMLPLHRDFEGPSTFPLLQCLIPLTHKGLDYEGGDFRLITASGEPIMPDEHMNVRTGDLLIFDKSLQHEVLPTQKGATGIGRWTLLVGVRAPPRSRTDAIGATLGQGVRNGR